MTKRREWVKNAAIVFLSLMLVLTFFSNTIMNYSLPEVSAQYASSGMVASRVRGTGTVEAAEPYHVKVSEEKTIEEVLVKEGDMVKKGKALFRLEKGGEGSLDATIDELDAANIEYQTKLLETVRNYDIPNAEITRLKEDLENAREDLEDAKGKRALVGNQQAQITVAKNKVDACQAEARLLQNQIEQLQREIDSLSSEEAVTAAEEAAVESAENNLNIAMANQETAARDLTRAEGNLSKKESELATAKAELREAEAAAEEYRDEDAISKLKTTVSSLQSQVSSLASAVSSAQTSVDSAATSVTYWTNEKKKADKALEKAKANAQKAQTAKKKELQSQLDALTAAKSDADYKLEQAQKALEEAQKDVLTEDEAEKAVKAAEEAVKAAQRALEDKILSLADTKGNDAKTDQVAKMQLDVSRKKIARLEKKIAKLRKEGEKTEVKAPVAGVVSSISAVAGDKTTPDSVLAVIQIVEKGYQVKLQVTTEQSKKVREGDQADVLNVWEGDVTAVVSKIDAVEGDVRSKMLVFQVGGSVEVGQSLELSVGQQNANYDTVVPNSAIREDSDGKFVLTVIAKSSPLGNRYMAQRVKVDVLAQDDTRAAITGDLQGGDFIIATSTKPLTDGMQVRLAEGSGL